MELVAPNIFTFTGLGVGRSYLLEDKEGYTIIDASIPPAAKKIPRQMAAAGKDIERLQHLLITHAHPDHVGAAAELISLSGAELLISEVDRPVLNGELPIPSASRDTLKGLAKFCIPPATTLENMTATRGLEDGEMLDILGGLQVILTPGHAPGHAAFWHPDRRILFCGDVIFNMPRLRLPYSFLTVDMDENKRSIAKLAALKPELILFGHGKPIKQNATLQLQGFAKKVGAI